MTVLLEMKQKLKRFYGTYDTFILPIIKFVVAIVYFLWINQNLGYMQELNNPFIVLILALICCVMPNGVTVFAGYVLMLGHCYAVGPECAGFLLVLLLFMMILFLRFSSGRNIILAFAPLSFALNVPVLLPIGSGLLSNAAASIPAGCGIIIYYFVRLVRAQSPVLTDPGVLLVDKLILLADGMVQNWSMWVNVIAVMLVIILVYIIRTRSFDYAWRIAIIIGGIAYVCMILAGGFYLNVQINMIPLIVYTIVAVLIGLVLEFLVFGGDYSRVERLEFEDDDYIYYVKAIPKSSISTSERSIKKINAEPVREEKRKEDKKKEEKALTYANPIFRGDEQNGKKRGNDRNDKNEEPLLKNKELEQIDFEKKLEESLKDL